MMFRSCAFISVAALSAGVFSGWSQPAGPMARVHRPQRGFAPVPAAWGARSPNVPQQVAHEWIVRFRPGVPPARYESVIHRAAAKATVIPLGRRPQAARQGPVGGSIFHELALARLAPGTDPESAVTSLQLAPEIRYVEPNYRVQTTGRPILPNDFEFREQWALRNEGQSGGQRGADIRAAEAWEVTTGDKDLIVAVIDTGIDYFHPDLLGNLWVNRDEVAGNGLDDDGNGWIDDVHGYDFVSDDSDPWDDNSHGTHVAGIIGARGNNERGVSGICWDISLMPLKAFDELGNGSVSESVAAIEYAVAKGARIINASWGLDSQSRVLEEAIRAAHAAGVILVAAAGNNRNEAPFYPAAYPDVLAVAATDHVDQRARFSSYGSFIDLAAPGDGIYSTFPDNRYNLSNGTSMAAPLVSGAAALVLSRHPDFSNLDVINILRNTTDQIASDQYLGTGRLNAGRAVHVEFPLPAADLQLGATLRGIAEIRGTAAGDRFIHFVLAYGAGVMPTNWIEVARSEVPVVNGVLLAGWDTSALGEGTYTVRLSVFDQVNQSATARVLAAVRNVALDFPLNNDVLRRGAVIPIRGTVFGRGTTYRLEYAAGGVANPIWHTQGIHLRPGTEPVLGGELATWDTGTVSSNGFYRLRLSAFREDRPVGEAQVYMVRLESALKPGWPQYIPSDSESQADDWRNLSMADLDGDGRQEIMVVEGARTEAGAPRLLVLAADGQRKWSRSLESGLYVDTPVAGDVNGDGRAEIFVEGGDGQWLHAFQFDGTPLGSPWPVRLEVPHLGKVLADLDGDGFLELIGYAENIKSEEPTVTRQLLVLDHEGRTIRKWHLSGCAAGIGAPKMFPAVGNLDADAALEIVAVASCDTIAAFDLNNSIEPAWRAVVAGELHASPVIGDLDGNGTNEIVIGAFDRNGTASGGLYGWDNRGRPLPGWPVLVEESFATAPALGDVNGGGDVEICIASWRSELIHLVHPNGFELAGWPVKPGPDAKLKTSPVIGDVNGDGRPDIVLAAPGHVSQTPDRSYGTTGGVFAWSLEGASIKWGDFAALPMESPGWGTWFKAAPVALVDLDGDGRLEVVASSIQDIGFDPNVLNDAFKNRGSVYVWELDAPHEPAFLPWPRWRADSLHTARYQRRLPPNIAPRVQPMPNQIVRSGTPFFAIPLDRYVIDPDGRADRIQWEISGTNQLIVILDPNRVARITPLSASWEGNETLRFTAIDAAGARASTTASFTARLNYDPPPMADDFVSTREDTTAVIDVLANDAAGTGAASDWQIVHFSPPASGTLSLDPDQRFVYRPADDFHGTDSFDYAVDDGRGGFGMARARVEVLPEPDPPVARDDRAMTWEDSETIIAALDNDRDPDDEALSVLGFEQPAQGTLRHEGGGVFRYTPNADFHGSDQFEYRIQDPLGQTATGRVSVIVKSLNDPPVATNQAFALNKNLFRDIFFAEFDIDGDKLEFAIVDGPQHGELWVYPTIATYYPMTNFTGEDSFTFRLDDGAQQSAPGTVSIQVLNQNNAPQALSLSVTTKRDQSIAVTPSAKDADQDPIFFQVQSQPKHGSVVSSNAVFYYQPEAEYLGPDSFRYEATDGRDATSAEVRINVTELNTAPIARHMSVETRVNESNNFVLDATDPEGDRLQFVTLSLPGHGELTRAGEAFVYTPTRDYIGLDRFTFKANDGELSSAEAIVTITVQPRNTRPIVRTQNHAAPRDAETPINLIIIDPDSDTFQTVILKGPKYGRLYGAGGLYTYVPDPRFVGPDSFSYRVWDGNAFSDRGEVYINVFLPDAQNALRFGSVHALGHGPMRLNLIVQPARPLEIHVSTNLVDWVPLMELTPTSAAISLVDTNSSALSRRFYRAVQR